MSTNIDNFNQDELSARDWLNADFFTTVLQSCQKDDSIRVKDVKLSPATLKGDHYASVMFRARVEYENVADDWPAQLHSSSMIIKTMPEVESNKKRIIQDTFIFETEIAMYTKVIPKFEEMLRQKGDETVMGARCLYHSLSPKKLIILEDIVPLGYEVLRGRQVNMEEAKLNYTKLAKWHAMSYIINQENPAFFDEFSHNFMEFAEGEMASFFQTGIVFFIETLATRPTLVKYKPYFEALQPTLIEKCRMLMDEYRTHPQKDGHYVLCHGDFHDKNIMFKRTADRPAEDVMLLDFQICYIGSMVSDLIYSSYTMLSQEMRRNHLDELIHYYFCCFTETLDRLEYVGRRPKLLDLRQMLLKHKELEILFLMTLLPLCCAFKEGTDPDKLVNCEDFRKSFYSNKEFLSALEECLPKFLHLGYLENSAFVDVHVINGEHRAAMQHGNSSASLSTSLHGVSYRISKQTVAALVAFIGSHNSTTDCPSGAPSRFLSCMLQALLQAVRAGHRSVVMVGTLATQLTIWTLLATISR